MAKTKAEKTWPCWTDSLGQTYAPGDLVAYAALNGTSALMRYGEVVRINRINSKGEEIVKAVGWRDDKGVWQRRTSPSCTVTVRPITADFRVLTRNEPVRKKGTAQYSYEYEKDADGKTVYQEKPARLVTILLQQNVLAISTTPDNTDEIVERLMALQNDLEGGTNE